MARRLPIVFAMSVALGASGWATERGTPAEARAMLAKACEHYKAVRRKQALADFNSKKAPFGDRDLYVFCIGPDRVIVANGGYPSYVGASADILKDAEGKLLGKALLEAGSREGGGSVEYPHLNPVSHRPEGKVSFVQKVGEDVCGVGAYNAK
jgi:cytochrome c